MRTITVTYSYSGMGISVPPRTALLGPNGRPTVVVPWWATNVVISVLEKEGGRVVDWTLESFRVPFRAICIVHGPWWV